MIRSILAHFDEMVDGEKYLGGLNPGPGYCYLYGFMQKCAALEENLKGYINQMLLNFVNFK